MNYYEHAPRPGDEIRERQRLVQAVRGAAVGVRARQVQHVVADPVAVGAYFGMPKPDRLAALQDPVVALVSNAKRYADEVARLAESLDFRREQDEATGMWNRFRLKAIGATALPNSYEDPGDPKSVADNSLLRTCRDGSRLAVSSAVSAEMHPDSSIVQSAFLVSRHAPKGDGWERVGETIFEVSGVESLTTVRVALPDVLEELGDADEEDEEAIRPGDMPSSVRFPGLDLRHNGTVAPDWNAAGVAMIITQASDQFALGASRLSRW